jgi:hypothetical protein
MKRKRIWPAIAMSATIVVLAGCGPLIPSATPHSPKTSPRPNATSAFPYPSPSSLSPTTGSPTTGSPTTGSPNPSPTSPSRTSASPTFGARCATSATNGRCGPYDYAEITGSGGSDTFVQNNIWNANSGTTQTLTASGPGSWSVVANGQPAGYTGVQTYPDTQEIYTRSDNTPDPLSGFSSIISSFSENMNAASGTSAEAAFDIWLGQSSSTNYANEVMIWNDQANRGSCGGAKVLANASFGGSNGVPQQNWTLCKWGSSELIWYLTSGNESSGVVDVLSMLTWLESHGHLPANSGVNQIQYGFEICSTPGPETFTVSQFAIKSPCNSGASC